MAEGVGWSKLDGRCQVSEMTDAVLQALDEQSLFADNIDPTPGMLEGSYISLTSSSMIMFNLISDRGRA